MTTDPKNGVTEAAAPLAQPPKVRMDRSRAFSSVHGERHPTDIYAKVHFMQDGIPVDASGHFVFDHPLMEEAGPEGDARRKAALKHIKRHAKSATKQKLRPEPTEDQEIDDQVVSEGDDEDEDDDTAPINLEAWLRGEQDVEWNEVSQEIARRYKRRVSKLDDAVAFLVKEGVVPKAQLRPKWQKFAE